jgi:excisionase family DNA binding protein
MLILSPADRAALWQQTVASPPEEREGMLRVLAKEMQEIVGTDLEVYFGLDEQFEQTLHLLDRSGLIGRDELRQAFEIVGIDEEEGERGIDAAEFVLVMAGYLEETAGVEHLSAEDRLAAHRLAGLWRDQVAKEEAPETAAILTVAEVASHFGVTPQAIYKWCEGEKIEFERTPGGSYRIPAAQFDWARGQASRQARREITERLLAKRGAQAPPSEEELVAAMRKARNAE